jgi:hypothetical protein
MRQKRHMKLATKERDSAGDVVLTWLSRDAKLRLVFHPSRKDGAYQVTCGTMHCWASS